MLRPGAEQHLRHGQAHQLRVGQLLRPARPTSFRSDDMVVDEYVEFGQEGIQFCCHKRSWMPSSHVLIKTPRRPAEFGITHLVSESNSPSCSARTSSTTSLILASAEATRILDPSFSTTPE